MVADGDPRRGKGIGWYLRVQYVLPRRWVVVVVAGEPCVDGGPCSSGRRFGQSWISLEGAKRTLLEPEADGGGRSGGRRAPRGSSSGWAGSGEVVELCGGESGLGGAIYSRPEAVAVNR